jgi:hypothetical protein
MTDQEIEFIMDAIASTVSNFREWMTDYHYDPSSNEYTIKEATTKEQHWVEDWFNGHKADCYARLPSTV